MSAAPNVIVIMSDQHHPGFLGCAGEPILQTPNLDRLARTGCRFQNAYCNFPLCSPARMSFMTARLPSDIECLTNQSILGSDYTTFAHAFGAAGYETVLCGRMHFNGPDQRHGFDRRICADVLRPTEYAAGLEPVLGKVFAGTTGPNARSIRRSGPGHTGYDAYDSAVTRAAITFLQERTDKDRPFLLTVGYVLPHAPFVAPPDQYAIYDAQISADDLPKSNPEKLHPELRRLRRQAGLEDDPPLSIQDQRRARVAYYGMCTRLDGMIGELLNAVETEGFGENTIIVYTSDHGEQLGEHGLWWKHTFYEASLGVPLLIAGTGVPGGTVIEQNVSLMDLGPTLLEMTGSPAIPGATGQSFRCLLDGKCEKWSNTVIAENIWPPNRESIQRMIRRGRWKLCHYPGFAPQLFDLANDPHELHDVAAEGGCASIREELLTALMKGFDEERALARHHAKWAGYKWRASWWDRCDLPEPDPPWFNSPPVNQLHTPQAEP